MIHNDLFSATNHRGVLVPKVEGIDLQYIRYVLEPIFRELKMGRAGDNGENEYTSLPPFRVKNAKFSIPVKEDGTFDLEVQKAIAQKYVFIDQMKDTIREKLDSLICQQVKL